MGQKIARSTSVHGLEDYKVGESQDEATGDNTDPFEDMD